MGKFRQLIGLEDRPQYRNGELIVAECPNGHELTAKDVETGDAGRCPVCRKDLIPETNGMDA